MESTATVSPVLPPGYRTYAYEDPFEDLVGPIGYRIDGGAISFAFRSDQRHANTGGTLHGGMLMTFADYALCLTAVWDQPGEKCVTVSCNCEFVAAGQPGDVVEATGEVTRRTRSLTFVRGQLTAGGRLLLTFSAIVKRLRGARAGAPAA
ncbi:MAG: PaaI family thioesterase [Acidobacteria bacterium]|nr:PaaI family thioesterase [Acidobacteriota bacterium]